MRVTPENFVKVGVMAIVAIFLARQAADRLAIPGLRQLVG